MRPSIGADGLYLDCALLSDEAGWNSQRLWDVSDIVLYFLEKKWDRMLVQWDCVFAFFGQICDVELRVCPLGAESRNCFKLCWQALISHSKYYTMFDLMENIFRIDITHRMRERESSRAREMLSVVHVWTVLNPTMSGCPKKILEDEFTNRWRARRGCLPGTWGIPDVAGVVMPQGMEDAFCDSDPRFRTAPRMKRWSFGSQDQSD